MKSLIQVIISSLILCVATSSFADETKNKEKQRIKTQNMKFMMITPVKSLSLIQGGLLRSIKIVVKIILIKKMKLRK
jgi:hypothetical protein